MRLTGREVVVMFMSLLHSRRSLLGLFRVMIGLGARNGFGVWGCVAAWRGGWLIVGKNKNPGIYLVAQPIQLTLQHQPWRQVTNNKEFTFLTATGYMVVN